MPGHLNRCALLFTAFALLAACKAEPPANDAANMSAPDTNEAVTDVEEIPADEDAAANPSIGTLIPPAPGEPGGLPDDRRPLDETAARDPTNVAASGSTVELFGLALSEGRYGQAYRYWGDGGRQSGMSEAEFASSYARYSEIHVLVGRPEAGGTQTARVPVQMYGRLRDGGTPFNLYGIMTLARNPKGQKGEPGQPPWLIASSDLKPQGEVKLSQAPIPAQPPVMPASFQGRWTQDSASCGRPGDPTRLQVRRESLIFHESVARITRVDPVGPDEVRITATYRGEGETWSRDSRLRLSDGDRTLTLDGMKRVRCLA